MSRSRTWVAAAIAAGVVLTGCSGGDEPEAGESPSASPSEQAQPPTLWPLTGETADEDTDLDHPVMVTKIDNTSSSAPQVGLGSADLVVEELVEGGSTRLAAFFYSDLPEQVGPVRSMRSSDIGIAKPAQGTLVASGAAGPTLQRLNAEKVPFIQEGQGEGFSRAGDRSAPYNVMADLKAVAEGAKDTGAPASYLPWGAFPTKEGKPAKQIDVKFSAGHTTSWKYDGKAYTNTNSNAAKGDEFVPENVLVLKVPVGDAGYRDPAGNTVPETKFTGSGEAMLFSRGKVITGTWKKQGLGGELKLSTKSGVLTVPGGHTWIELVPQDGGSVSY